MNSIDPFSSLTENLGELDLKGRIYEFFKLLREESRKDDDNECTVLKCSLCEGLLVQMPDHLPLKVRCMNCESQFVLRDIVIDEK